MFVNETAYHPAHFQKIFCSFYRGKRETDHRVCALQLTVFFLTPYVHLHKQVTSSGIVDREELLHHTHIKSLTKAPGPGDQRHTVEVFPPFFDERGLIYIECVIFDQFFIALTANPDSSCHGRYSSLNNRRGLLFLIISYMTASVCAIVSVYWIKSADQYPLPLKSKSIFPNMLRRNPLGFQSCGIALFLDLQEGGIHSILQG